jgi:hypothetical protein
MTHASRPRRFGRKGLLLAALAFVAIPASEASAGRLIVTGHDWDLHCGEGAPSQCGYTKTGVKYVRDGSKKKVLILDQPNDDVSNALTAAFNADFPRKIVRPTSDEWQTLKLTTDKFSAILVASDESCGGCDLNQVGLEDSIAINSRKKAIAKFFNQGGGIFVGAGADNGDSAGDIFYNFVPIPVGAAAVSPPFTLTNFGESLGFTDDPSTPGGSDINCCPTHNAFNNPGPGSKLRVAERDSEGFAETLAAEGQIRGGQIVGGDLKLKVKPKQVVQNQSTCFALKVTSGGDPLKKAKVKLGDGKAKTNKQGKATICESFGTLGKKKAKARKKGFGSDTANVFVVRDPGFTG